MDNPSSESALDTNQAASLFASVLGGEPVEEKKPEAPEAEADAPAVEAEEALAEETTAEEAEPMVTVKIDGKDVEVPLSELKNGYQRQADYTRKTMETAEQRKAAEAETAKARQERETYAANLNKIQAQLEGVLQEQQQIDWDSLLNSDPVEYLKQQHLFQQRQAKLYQVQQERQSVEAQQKAEAEKAQAEYIAAQHQALLDKLPEWKDQAKANAERTALREFLKEQGFEDRDVNSIADARQVLIARKAMLYDQMMSKAQAAAKKVATLPTKVERPGTGETNSLDRRATAYQKLSKSGKVEDAASLFASIL